METPSPSRKPRFVVSGLAPVRAWARAHPFLSLFIVLAILQLAEGGVWFISNQHRINENQAAIAKINHLGKERRALLARTDYQTCLVLKETNRRIRKTILAGPAGQSVFLHIVGIQDQRVIDEFYRQGIASARVTAAAFPNPKCGKLPSSQLTKGQK